MYDETEATACFDPNNISDSTVATANTTTIGGVVPQENGYSSHEPNNHNHQTQELDSCSMDFQNPNLGNHFNMIPNCNPPPPPPISGETNNNNNNNTHESNTWVHNNNVNNCNHEMGLGYTHFVDDNLQPTTDLLTLLHLPRCSSSSPYANAPTSISANNNTHHQSLSFGKPSSSPPPQPSALSFLGELNPAMMVDNPSGSGSSTISYDPTTPVSATAFSYDPMFHLNLPPQPSPLFRDLMFQSLPHYGFTSPGMRGNGNIGNIGNGIGNGNGNSSSLFGGLDDCEGNGMNGGIYQDGDHHIHGNGVFEFSKGDGKAGKCPKNFVTERQRRQNFNDKYQLLRSLVPNQTKGDRASIVWDAINHINELRRTVGELKLLVEKKRMAKERMKRHKTEQDNTQTPGGPTNGVGAGGDHHSNTTGVVDNAATAAMKPEPDEDFNGSAAIQLRSSWIQRKCKDTEVDVRIVDDDVTIKLVQRKKINCLLTVSRTLDDLQLDLRHVAGGHVGDYYSYLFNSKICEGSSVYASAIANKLIEVVERQYAAASVAVAPTSSY